MFNQVQGENNYEQDGKNLRREIKIFEQKPSNNFSTDFDVDSVKTIEHILEQQMLNISSSKQLN